MPTHILTGDTSYWGILMVVLLRYLILASIGYLIFYVVWKRRFLYRKIQLRLPKNIDYIREVFFSGITTIIFAAIGYLVFATPFSQYTKAYWKIADFGIVYFVGSIALMLLVHDTYFYWTHRWMHHKSVFRFVHRVHHLSTNPSPWAAMAFHPLESIVEGSVIVLIAFLFPVHPLAIGIFLLIMMIYNVYGHLGYELYPKGFSRSRIGRWINTSVNHNMHHEHVRGNYGLYFLWWDRWMGTLQSRYEDNFEQIQSRISEDEPVTRALDSIGSS
jgi:sterol desaturase/sphingolipid hydroxylase (fatty acid hydroxylase superfamily)